MKLSIQVEVMENGYLITATQQEEGGQYKDRIEKKYVAYDGSALDAKIAEIKDDQQPVAGKDDQQPVADKDDEILF